MNQSRTRPTAHAAAVVGAAALLTGLALSTAVISAAAAGPATVAVGSNGCPVRGPVAGLNPEQAGNAEAIVSTTLAATGGSLAATRIAVMVGYTESSLLDLGPRPGNDGSLGLFQQRASQGWGTRTEELDPVAATAMFVDRLLSVPAWQTMAPWLAAQAVQRSAFADGRNYQANWLRAGSILDAIAADGDRPGGCGQASSSNLAGPTATHGLPAGYAIPSGTPPEHATAIGYALAQLGKPYQWGAAGPMSFDCSGLTMEAWAAAGVVLNHYTVDQEHEGVRVAAGQVSAGDLVLIPGSDPPGPGLPGHVGIYLGYGLVVSAVDVAVGIAVQTWSDFTGGGLDAVIDPAPGQ